ncbi:MAG TPA: hypothetical protein VMB73_14740 [Acetobacteraceae bacterium]|nr:hypothetical protein [Acetobacteraceae bacterium]
MVESLSSPGRRCLASAGIVAALLLGLMGCAVSPVPHTQASAFMLETPAGSVGVGVRQPLPDMTIAESQALIMAAMQKVLPGVAPDPNASPRLLVVWHVTPIFPSCATWRLSLNIFDGSVPVWNEQTIIGSDESRQALTSAMARMTSRLAAEALGPARDYAGHPTT